VNSFIRVCKQNGKEIFLGHREVKRFVLLLIRMFRLCVRNVKDGYEMKYNVYINKLLHFMLLLQIEKL